MVSRIDDVDLERDRSLVERAQAGDGAAFAELYARYFARLRRFCERRIGDAHEAEEVAQEAFTRAYRALEGFDGERRFYPWLSVIASRLCVDVHRRRARSQPSAEIDGGWVDGGQEAILRTVDRDRVQAAMAKLSPRHQEILRRREWDGWSYQQLAGHFGLSMAGTEALLWRARQALRREVERLDVGDSRWAAMPLLGWVMRRLAGLRHPAVTAAGGSVAPLIGGALSVAVIGVLALGAGSVAQGRHGPVPTVQLPAGSSASSSRPPAASPAASPPQIDIAGPAGSASPPPPSGPAAPPPATAAGRRTYRPVYDSQLGQAGPAAQGAGQQPVSAAVAGSHAGIDPVQSVTDLASQVKSLEIRRTP